MMKQFMIRTFGTLLIGAVLFITPGYAQQAPRPVPSGPWYEDDTVFIRIVQRSPEQLNAFYLGREFNQASIDRILETCFVTPIIHNKRFDVLWLELDNWQFSRGEQQIPRIKRGYWPAKWQLTGLSQAHQSTFGWTLMPEVRDLRLDESVGGSVVIPLQSLPFTLTMNFHSGVDKQGPLKTIVFKDLECVTDKP
jgi:hypothetical protein